MRVIHLTTRFKPISRFDIPDTEPDTSRIVKINELDIPDDGRPMSRRIISAMDPKLANRIPLYPTNQDMTNLREKGWFILCREGSTPEDLLHWIVDLDCPDFTDLKRELALVKILD